MNFENMLAFLTLWNFNSANFSFEKTKTAKGIRFKILQTYGKKY